MAGIDIARLRQQNLFPEVVDMSGGTMSMGPPPTSSPYEIDPFEQEQPVYDPRTPVNPTISQPQQTPVGGPGSRGQMTAEELKVLIDQFYTPETTSRDRFNRLLDEAPEREDPSFARRLVAAGMGFGQPAKDALGTMEGVMYAPHARNMADWTAKTTPFSQAAQQENTSNVNERTLAGNVITGLNNANRYAEQYDIGLKKAESEKIRAYAQYLKTQQYKIEERGSRVVAYNPNNPREAPIDLGASGDMDRRDLEILKGNFAVDAARARGQSALDIANASQTGQNYRADAAGWVILQNPDGSYIRWNERTGAKQEYPSTGAGQSRDVTDPPGGRSGAASATANRVERNMKWQQVYDESGPDIRKWMIPPSSPNGDWNMRDAPSATVGWFPWSQDPNPDITSYNQARQALGLPPMASAPPPPVEAKPPVQSGNQPIGGSNVVPSPPVPQGQPGMVGGQQRYMQPPVDFSNPPSTRTGVGGVQQPLGTPTQAQPQAQPQSQTPMTKSQADQMIASGQLLIAIDAQGKRYIVPNTQAGIEDALRRNLRVQTPQGR